MKWFHSFDTMDWGRVSLLVGGATVFWVTMGAVVPDPYYKWISTFLLAVSNTVALMMRSGVSRVEKIEEKLEDHHADAVKKTEEIRTLIVNEVQEQAEK